MTSLTSAMRIGGKHRLDSIGTSELLVAARKLELSEEAARERIEAIRGGIASAFATAAQALDDPFAKTVVDAIERIVADRGWTSHRVARADDFPDGALDPTDAMNALSRVRVGTCGWSKPAWRARFYPRGLPEREQLGFASRHLTTLEINTTFHGVKKPEDFLNWYAETPDDFVFSVKGYRGITHENPLRSVEKSLATFFSSGVTLLREKLGPILWQVSDALPFNADVVSAFLSTLPHSIVEACSLIAHAGLEADRASSTCRTGPSAMPSRCATLVSATRRSSTSCAVTMWRPSSRTLRPGLSCAR
jgi:hypothetical protein